LRNMRRRLFGSAGSTVGGAQRKHLLLLQAAASAAAAAAAAAAVPDAAAAGGGSSGGGGGGCGGSSSSSSRNSRTDIRAQAATTSAGKKSRGVVLHWRVRRCAQQEGERAGGRSACPVVESGIIVSALRTEHEHGRGGSNGHEHGADCKETRRDCLVAVHTGARSRCVKTHRSGHFSRKRKESKAFTRRTKPAITKQPKPKETKETKHTTVFLWYGGRKRCRSSRISEFLVLASTAAAAAAVAAAGSRLVRR
jgi:hypothetical protein